MEGLICFFFWKEDSCFDYKARNVEKKKKKKLRSFRRKKKSTQPNDFKYSFTILYFAKNKQLKNCLLKTHNKIPGKPGGLWFCPYNRCHHWVVSPRQVRYDKTLTFKKLHHHTSPPPSTPTQSSRREYSRPSSTISITFQKKLSNVSCRVNVTVPDRLQDKEKEGGKKIKREKNVRTRGMEGGKYKETTY